MGQRRVAGASSSGAMADLPGSAAARGASPFDTIDPSGRIVRALSTALAGDFLDFDRIEVLDPIEVTVDDLAELSVRNRTGP